MARWEPNARLRLVRAAVELFAERGYDSTTVQEIADRAGLTKMTFFRHFPDKREVMFAGQDIHAQLLSDAIASSPASATPLTAVGAALDALTGTFTDDRREMSTRLRVVIDGNDELRERAGFKRAGLAAAMAGALRQRGVPEPAAGLAAELGMRAFDQAYDQWLDPAASQTLTELARRALDQLRNAAAMLSGG
jgi:AcrR family transcriptional regulator